MAFDINSFISGLAGSLFGGAIHLASLLIANRHNSTLQKASHQFEMNKDKIICLEKLLEDLERFKNDVRHFTEYMQVRDIYPKLDSFASRIRLYVNDSEAQSLAATMTEFDKNYFKQISIHEERLAHFGEDGRQKETDGAYFLLRMTVLNLSDNLLNLVPERYSG